MVCSAAKGADAIALFWMGRLGRHGPERRSPKLEGCQVGLSQRGILLQAQTNIGAVQWIKYLLQSLAVAPT